ncbi:FAD:protein FMN transferase [Candidatus Pelagadaptatus aseana]|uniref:FAD:protein FMN transferase n=1 Tax=Candidatus Pelagadaptatus aseana TaxID=3120508 RepID=UPI003C6F0C4B
MLGALFFLLLGCSEQAREFSSLSGATMGTTYHITVVAKLSTQEQSELQVQIDDRLKGINQSMSTYIEDSELSILNRSAIQQWQPVSGELFDVLEMSQQLHQLSSGAFDITVGPLVNRWGFGPGFTIAKVPDQAEIEHILSMIGAQYLQLDSNGSQALRDIPIELDLSAIAKGYGVDKVAELLVAKGYNDFLVEIGGEIRVSGLNKFGNAWRIGIERPVASMEKLVQKSIAVSDYAIATSGDYRNFYEVADKRYSHTIDPRTGFPVEHNLVSVTVLDPLCARADGLATAFNVMGHEKALLLANSEGIAAFFIIQTESGFQEFSSDAFKRIADAG